jgi:hypothetical protein
MLVHRAPAAAEEEEEEEEKEEKKGVGVVVGRRRRIGIMRRRRRRMRLIDKTREGWRWLRPGGGLLTRGGLEAEEAEGRVLCEQTEKGRHTTPQY